MVPIFNEPCPTKIRLFKGPRVVGFRPTSQILEIRMRYQVEIQLYFYRVQFQIRFR